MDEKAIERLAAAVAKAHKRPDPLDALASAVTGVFTEAAERDGGQQGRWLALADTVEAHRAWQARSARKYGPREAMLARMEARGGRGGLSARIWC